jgi:hypothetical protein
VLNLNLNLSLGGRAVPVEVSSGLGLPGRWLVRKYYIFFSWMKRNKNHGCASFLTGKSQTDDSRLQTRLGAGWENVAWGIA